MATMRLVARRLLAGGLARGMHGRLGRGLCSGPSDGDMATSTTIVQDGLYVKELPIIVRKTTDPATPRNSDHAADPSASAAGIDADLNACTTRDEIFRYIEFLHLRVVTPLTALAILARIGQLEPDDAECDGSEHERFAYSAIVWKLCSLVCCSKDADVVLAGLNVALRGRFASADVADAFVRECLLRASEGKLDIEQTCELAEALAHDPKVVDNLWANVVDRAHEIHEGNLLKAFEVLPLLRATRRVVLNALERRTSALFWRLTADHVADILKVLSRCRQEHARLLATLTKWVNVNVHTLSEQHLVDVLRSLAALGHTDTSIRKAVGRFAKARGQRLKDASLLRMLADYCTQFRWRSVPVLDAVSEFVCSGRAEHVPPEDLCSLVKVFGTTNHQPRDPSKFFEVVEPLLSKHFSHLPPDEVVEVMLSCIHLQRYPLNFVQKVFSPFFLDRINTSLSSQQEVTRTHDRLKLLDWALALECPQYRGPLLPRNLFAKSLRRDARLTKMVAWLSDAMADVLGGEDHFGRSVVLPRLPLSENYIVDFVVHLDAAGSPLPYHKVAGIARRVAVLIHLPEHYCLDEEHLVGSQATRIRQLQLLGFGRVACCDYDTLERMHASPKELREYLGERIFEHQ